MSDYDMDRGLYVKYEVFKTDTGELVKDCFVLRPDVDKAAREALRAYAKATPNYLLARDILLWLEKIESWG